MTTQPQRKKIQRKGATRPWQETELLGREEFAVAPKARESSMATPLPSNSQPTKEDPRLPVFAKAVSKIGKIYNGFEYSGAENIPRTGAALIVFYHGLIPLDAWYFGVQYYLDHGRLIHGLGDRWIFKAPGLKQLAEIMGVHEGSPKNALDLLKAGEVVAVSPGGVREAISGTANNYKLIWKHRTGFAKVALEAKVDIIPAFSENVEELYRAPFAGSHLIQNLYEKTRVPVVPLVGLGLLPFPVKIKTWIGSPIRHDPRDTPEQLVQKTRVALESLIAKHQSSREQSVPGALVKRWLGWNKK